MSFRGGRGAPRGGGGGFSRGGPPGGRGGRGGFRGGRGGFGGAPAGPPEYVQEMGSFVHAVESEMLCSSTDAKHVPYFNAPIYLQNKSQIGKVDEILGPINEVYFTVKMDPGMVAGSFKPDDKVYIGGDKLLPVERFLPKPKVVQKGPKKKKMAGARGGAARGGMGRGGGRGGFGGRGGGFGGRGGARGAPGGRGGFSSRGGGGFSRGGGGGGGRGAPRGGRGGGFGGSRGRGGY